MGARSVILIIILYIYFQPSHLCMPSSLRKISMELTVYRTQGCRTECGDSKESRSNIIPETMGAAPSFFSLTWKIPLSLQVGSTRKLSCNRSKNVAKKIIFEESLTNGQRKGNDSCRPTSVITKLNAYTMYLSVKTTFSHFFPWSLNIFCPDLMCVWERGGGSRETR